MVRHRRQYLHQSDESVEGFVTSNGWDALVSLRGLKKITVKRAIHFVNVSRSYDMTTSALKALEDFLMTIVTKPKVIVSYQIPKVEIFLTCLQPKTQKQLADERREEARLQKKAQALLSAAEMNDAGLWQPTKSLLEPALFQPTLTSSRPSRAAAARASANNTRLLANIDANDEEEVRDGGELVSNFA